MSDDDGSAAAAAPAAQTADDLHFNEEFIDFQQQYLSGVSYERLSPFTDIRDGLDDASGYELVFYCAFCTHLVLEFNARSPLAAIKIAQYFRVFNDVAYLASSPPPLEPLREMARAFHGTNLMLGDALDAWRDRLLDKQTIRIQTFMQLPWIRSRDDVTSNPDAIFEIAKELRRRTTEWVTEPNQARLFAFVMVEAWFVHVFTSREASSGHSMNGLLATYLLAVDPLVKLNESRQVEISDATPYTDIVHDIVGLKNNAGSFWRYLVWAAIVEGHARVLFDRRTTPVYIPEHENMEIKDPLIRTFFRKWLGTFVRANDQLLFLSNDAVLSFPRPDIDTQFPLANMPLFNSAISEPLSNAADETWAETSDMITGPLKKLIKKYGLYTPRLLRFLARDSTCIDHLIETSIKRKVNVSKWKGLFAAWVGGHDEQRLADQFDRVADSLKSAVMRLRRIDVLSGALARPPDGDTPIVSAEPMKLGQFDQTLAGIEKKLAEALEWRRRQEGLRSGTWIPNAVMVTVLQSIRQELDDIDAALDSVNGVRSNAAKCIATIDRVYAYTNADDSVPAVHSNAANPDHASTGSTNGSVPSHYSLTWGSTHTTGSPSSDSSGPSGRSSPTSSGVGPLPDDPTRCNAATQTYDLSFREDPRGPENYGVPAAFQHIFTADVVERSHLAARPSDGSAQPERVDTLKFIDAMVEQALDTTDDAVQRLSDTIDRAHARLPGLESDAGDARRRESQSDAKSGVRGALLRLVSHQSSLRKRIDNAMAQVHYSIKKAREVFHESGGDARVAAGPDADDSDSRSSGSITSTSSDSSTTMLVSGHMSAALMKLRNRLRKCTAELDSLRERLVAMKANMQNLRGTLTAHTSGNIVGVAQSAASAAAPSNDGGVRVPPELERFIQNLSTLIRSDCDAEVPFHVTPEFMPVYKYDQHNPSRHIEHMQGLLLDMPKGVVSAAITADLRKCWNTLVQHFVFVPRPPDSSPSDVRHLVDSFRLVKQLYADQTIANGRFTDYATTAEAVAALHMMRGSNVLQAEWARRFLHEAVKLMSTFGVQRRGEMELFREMSSALAANRITGTLVHRLLAWMALLFRTNTVSDLDARIPWQQTIRNISTTRVLDLFQPPRRSSHTTAPRGQPGNARAVVNLSDIISM